MVVESRRPYQNKRAKARSVVKNKRANVAVRPVHPVPRKKTVKKKLVRQGLRKFVKSAVDRELACKADWGMYNKNYCSDIKPSFSTDDEVCWITGARYANVNSPTTGSEQALAFLPCTLNKILDAASILYNNKTKSIAWENTTNNFGVAGFKLNHIYSSYKLTTKNMYPFDLDFEVYEVRNKLSADSNLMTTVDNNVGNIKWIQGVPPVNNSGGNEWSLDRGLDLSMIRGLEKLYEIKRVLKKRVCPGGEFIYFRKRGKECIDMSKYTTTGGSLLPDYCKGDYQVVMRITPALHINYANNAGSTNGHASHTNNPSPSSAPENRYRLVFGVEEVFKFEMPGETDEAYEGTQRTIFTRDEIVTDFINTLSEFRDAQNEYATTST